MSIQKRLEIIKESSIFQFAVTAIILLSSLIVGINTYQFETLGSRILLILDTGITVFFVLRGIIKGQECPFFSWRKK